MHHLHLFAMVLKCHETSILSRSSTFNDEEKIAENFIPWPSDHSGRKMKAPLSLLIFCLFSFASVHCDEEPFCNQEGRCGGTVVALEEEVYTKYFCLQVKFSSNLIFDLAKLFFASFYSCESNSIKII